jgi:methyltransferase (TIGR00027 family)
MSDSPISHVSDTALWVAAYREKETQRTDSLFKDVFVSKLLDEKSRTIATRMKNRYVAWSVVIRTCIIDRYIEEAIQGGTDTVVNLGAGLDTRPYRMNLPAKLKWIEVDFPHMIEHKENRLQSDVPQCQLERIKLDLSQTSARQALFSRINSESKNILVLTEGVTPYLSNDETADLAKDLRAQSHFKLWITDYVSHAALKHMRSPKRKKLMEKAPFKFDPADWFAFFKSHGWEPNELRYLGEESEKLGRSTPVPFWAKLFVPSANRLSGYALLKRTSP